MSVHLNSSNSSNGNNVTRPRYFVVIPAYNEGATIRGLVEHVLQQKNIESVIVVNDGSVDDTLEQLKNIDGNITVLHNPVNGGKAAALVRGFQHVLKICDSNENNLNAIITLDGDGQHDPNDIPKFMAAHKEESSKGNANIVIGARLENNQEAPPFRLLANWVADFWVSWAAGQYVQDSQSGFRLYPTSLLRNPKCILPRHDKYASMVFETELLIQASWQGYTTQVVPIRSCYPKAARPSHYRPWSDITKVILMIAYRLIATGLNLSGLLRSQQQKAQRVASAKTSSC